MESRVSSYWSEVVTVLAWTKQNTMQRAMRTALEWPQSHVTSKHYKYDNKYICTTTEAPPWNVQKFWCVLNCLNVHQNITDDHPCFMIGPPLYIIVLFPGIKRYRQHILQHLSQRHLYLISLVHVRWVQFKMAVFSSNTVLYGVFCLSI